MHPEDQKIILHPGFIKTGTTTLQEHLFNVHSGIYALATEKEIKNQLSREFLRIDGMGYDEEQLGLLVGNALQANSGTKTIVYSNETLTSNPYLTAPITRRLKTFFPRAQILFTLRHQVRAIESYYARHGRVLTNAPRPFLNRHVPLQHWLEYNYQNRRTTYLGVLDYHRVIQNYEREFGPGRIHLLLFEDFVNDKDAFIQTLCELLVIDFTEAKNLLAGQWSNPRESSRYVAYFRFRKLFFPSHWTEFSFPGSQRLQKIWGRLIHAGKKSEITIPEKWRAILKEEYREGNRQLVERYGLALKKYGYPL